MLFPCKGSAQDQHEIDSLLSVLQTTGNDSAKAGALIDLGNLYRYSLPDSALQYFGEALRVSELLEDSAHIAQSRRSIGMVLESQGMYDRALEAFFAALSIYEATGSRAGIASCYNDIAIIHYLQESTELCMEYLTRSFEIKKELGDREGMSNYYTNMAALNTSLERYAEALGFSEKSLELYEEAGDLTGVAVAYGNLGSVHYELRNYRESLDNHLKSVEAHRAIGNRDGMAHSLSNVAGLYMLMADSLAGTEMKRKEYLEKAVEYGLRAYEMACDLEHLYVRNYAANTLMLAYRGLGDPGRALDYAWIDLEPRDSLFNEEKARAIEEMDTKYETEKKQQQIELQESQLLARDATIRRQKTVRNSLVGGLAAIGIIVFLVSYAYLQKRRDNRKIREQNRQISEANEELKQLNEEISAQKEEIETQRDFVFSQNEAINASINYAQRIQSALLPPETYIHEVLGEAFILFKPRDIVSGDFYWIKQVNHYVIVAAADCTGHGVPGAFMSMLGISFLNEIVQRREITQADQVLNELRHQIKHSLRQHGLPDEPKDGIDMALVVIDRKNGDMQYSGAHNPLYIIRDKQGEAELVEIKADRMPLGYYSSRDRAFANHRLRLETGDSFYLFSDGYVDQKGGELNKKFMSKRFKQLLLEILDRSMYEQKLVLEKTLADWTGPNPQIDDILVVGVRV